MRIEERAEPSLHTHDWYIFRTLETISRVSMMILGSVDTPKCVVCLSVCWSGDVILDFFEVQEVQMAIKTLFLPP